ncbi:MAG: hypothetical protein ABIH82_00205 [Candidatus Woesearchaeota archaeon]
MSKAVEIIHEQLEEAVKYYSSLLDLSVTFDMDIAFRQRRLLTHEDLETAVLGDNSFSFSHFRGLRNFHQKLSRISVVETALDTILQNHQAEIANNPLFSENKWVEGIRDLRRVNYSFALGAVVTGAYVPAVTYLLTALGTKVPKKDNPTSMKLLYGATMLSAFLTFISPNAVQEVAMLASCVPAGVALFGFARLKNKKEAIVDYLQKAKEYKAAFEFDGSKFLRAGKVIDVGLRHIRYVENVCDSDKREIIDYQDQLDVLDEVMVRYLLGGSEEELTNFSIRYLPKEWERKSVVTASLGPVIKNGYSPEEHAQLVAARQAQVSEVSRNDLSGNTREELERVDTKSSDIDDLPVYLSSKVQTLIERGGVQLDGQSIEDLVSSSIEKIQGKPRHEVIREHRSNARFMVTYLREQHGLSGDARVYKLKTRQGVRALYTLNEGAATIIEIVDHRQYERLLTIR